MRRFKCFIVIQAVLASLSSTGYSVEVSSQDHTLYNNARLVFHALDPNVRSKLEGIDPAFSIDVLTQLLDDFAVLERDNVCHIQTLQQSLATAKRNYLKCISMVGKQAEAESINGIAKSLAEEVEELVTNRLHPPVLFIGGFYAYSESGALGGHTATYEVSRQEDGRVQFIVTDTLPIPMYHQIDEKNIFQLVYADLTPSDLGPSFWENVIRINYLSPKKKIVMSSFYDYLDSELLKHPVKKTKGISYRQQGSGVCAWKSLFIWLKAHLEERSYHKFKKWMFETLLAHFHPDEEDPHSTFLKNELEKKVEKLNCKWGQKR